MRCLSAQAIRRLAHLDDLETLAGLALAVGDRNVRQQRRVADDRRKRVAVLVGRPFAEMSALRPVS